MKNKKSLYVAVAVLIVAVVAAATYFSQGEQFQGRLKFPAKKAAVGPFTAEAPVKAPAARKPAPAKKAPAKKATTKAPLTAEPSPKLGIVGKPAPAPAPLKPVIFTRIFPTEAVSDKPPIYLGDSNQTCMKLELENPNNVPVQISDLKYQVYTNAPTAAGGLFNTTVSPVKSNFAITYQTIGNDGTSSSYLSFDPNGSDELQLGNAQLGSFKLEPQEKKNVEILLYVENNPALLGEEIWCHILYNTSVEGPYNVNPTRPVVVSEK